VSGFFQVLSWWLFYAWSGKSDLGEGEFMTIESWFSKLAIRAGLVAMVVAALFGLSTQAQAAPAPAEQQQVALQAAGTDDFTILANHTFSRSATEQIYTVARAAGGAGLGVLCLAVAPGPVKAACPILVPVIMAFVPSHPPNGKCLNAYTKWTPPFWGVKYVNC
jgi:hypothetical protein